MKKSLLLFIAFLLLAGITGNAQVGIGTSNPASSAILDVNSTTKGLLPPRMSDVQRNAISNPVAGLMVWCINCGGSGELQVYNGTNWTKINGTLPSSDTNTSISICTQVWMKRNLDVSTYRNGDPIPKVTDAAAWTALTTGAYCYFNNDSATYAATYGKLYNWYAVNDPRGLAPAGWHIPSNAEWTTLETCLDAIVPTGNVGGKMKETGTTHWITPNTGATNTSGFTGLPGGLRDHRGPFDLANFGFWWSATEADPTIAWYLNLKYDNGGVERGGTSKRVGASVRCLRD